MTGSQLYSSKLTSSARFRRSEFGTGSCRVSRTCRDEANCRDDSVLFGDTSAAEPSLEEDPQLLTRPTVPRAAAMPAPWIDEEWANALTHGLGLALSVAGCVLLWMALTDQGTTKHIVGCAVYGGSLVALYAASTIYHCVRDRELKRLTQLLDHVCIYLLIAGTYTPFLLISLSGWTRWLLLATVWGAAGAGIIVKLRNADRLNETSFLPYLGLGGLAVIAIKPLLAAVPVGAMAWLIGGGVFYVAGIAFYANDHRRLFHSVWHLFVMGGSVCHFLAVLWHMIPGAG